ncbi:MAG: methionyl-tRNA formyltransferase, partial [Syntrophales bacterium]|nr:methionyl-tRNA formyltransferase [Syntrophales bacterium]
QAIKLTVSGTARRVAQDGSAATYAPRLKKEDGLIRWEDNVESIVNLIRGLSSHPGAYTFLDGKKLKILGAKAEVTAMGEVPGTISRQKGMGLTVASGNGYVHLLDMQLENKKRMPVEDFFRGYQVRPGSLLG